MKNKYNINDKVWKITKWGKAKEYKILGIIHTEESFGALPDDTLICSYYQIDMFDERRFEKGEIAFQKALVYENELFPSKEELIASL